MKRLELNPTSKVGKRPLISLLALAVLVAMILSGSHASAQTRTSHKVTSGAAALGPVHSKLVIRGYSPVTGKVAWKHTYPASTQGKTMHLPKRMTPMGSGTGHTSLDPVKVTISQWRWDVLHIVKVWKFHIWTKWTWYGAINHKVDATGWGESFDTDGTHHWSGDVAKSIGYYDYRAGVSHSGFKHYRKAEFDGVAVGGGPSIEYPENWLWSHWDGTWAWKTACC